MDLAAKGIGAKEWNNSLKTKLSLLPKKLFRIRMSRNFGMRVFFFQAEDGIRDGRVTGVQTCALPISLIMHWNGQHWARVAGPSPGTGATLNGIAAISARDIWAVGGYYATSPRTLTLHWEIGRASCRERV